MMNFKPATAVCATLCKSDRVAIALASTRAAEAHVVVVRARVVAPASMNARGETSLVSAAAQVVEPDLLV